VPAIGIGTQVLARVPHEAGAVYLLGAATDGVLAAADVRFAFVGAAPAPALGAIVGASTILCGAHDTGAVSTCASVDADAEVLARELDEAALDAFLDAHPGAMLIDVREPFEHVAAGASHWHGRAAFSVPLSRLADRAGDWLRSEQRPLVYSVRGLLLNSCRPFFFAQFH
jgi:cysteine desulfurase